MRKLVYGHGVNNSTSAVHTVKFINGKWVVVWKCPVYTDWVEMLRRCYDTKWKVKNPTYKEVTICEDWKHFETFKKWVIDIQPNENWQNCEPDKDFLISGNKHYAPDTVVYIPKSLNIFVNNSRKARGKLLLGVSTEKSFISKFRARCNNPTTGKTEHLGYYNTEYAAHKAWQQRKHQLACILADRQPDERVAKRLREMYAPDKDWTNK